MWGGVVELGRLLVLERGDGKVFSVQNGLLEADRFLLLCGVKV